MSKEIYGVWVHRKADNELYFGIDAHDEAAKKVFFAESPTFKERALFYGDEKVLSMCIISDNIAIDLMDHLWRVGIRPTGVNIE